MCVPLLHFTFIMVIFPNSIHNNNKFEKASTKINTLQRERARKREKASELVSE